jgi:hypothetical protein
MTQTQGHIESLTSPPEGVAARVEGVGGGGCTRERELGGGEEMAAKG